MKEGRDYAGDIAAIRSMMERTSKFLSLSGWAGVFAGIYALLGVYIAHSVIHFNPDGSVGNNLLSGGLLTSQLQVILLAVAILLLAVGTAIVLSYRKASRQGEKIWNATSRRLLANMAVPLVTGGLLVIILISKGFIVLLAPVTLIFYGLALYNAGSFTYAEVKKLGLFEIGLGLLGVFFTDYGLWFWAIGFGLLHIIYGIYIYYKYER